MKRQMKTLFAFGLFTLASALIITSATAQNPVEPPASRRSQNSPGTSERSVTFHNNFTSANITGALTLPSRHDPAPVALILTGADDTEGYAASSISSFMTRRGFATFRLPASALSGAAEDADLNALAALNFLRTRRDVRGNHAGIVAYGDGVRIAPAVAAQANAASFLVLLGGSVFPDSSNERQIPSTGHARPNSERINDLKNIHCPVLIVEGEFDTSGVRHSAAENEDAVLATLKSGGHSNFTVKTLPGLDQNLMVRSGSVYGESSSVPAVSASALKTTADWIAAQAKNSEAISDDVVESSVFHAQKPVQIFGIDLGTPYHSWYEWKPDIGGQRPIYGYWYW